MKIAVDYWMKESSVEGLTYPFIGVTGRQRGGFELMTYGIQDDAANDCANETDMLNFDILMEQV